MNNTNNNDEDQEYRIENSLSNSVDFDYDAIDEKPVERYFDVSSTSIIIRLSSLIFSSPKPKMTLAALLFGSGVDVGLYLNCDNTETAIAKMLGESKQNFNHLVKKLRSEFELIHTNTGKSSEASKSYTKTNYRKQKHD